MDFMRSINQGEKIFCRYPGGTLYTADESDSLMFEQYLKENHMTLEDYHASQEAFRAKHGYPGYYYYLNASRRMQFTLALLRAEQELKFTDLDDVRYNYLATRVLFPELLEYEVFKTRLLPHRSRLGWIDGLLATITDYASLEPRHVVELAQQISARFKTKDEELPPMFNYYSRVMMNLPLEVEGAPVDIDV